MNTIPANLVRILLILIAGALPAGAAKVAVVDLSAQQFGNNLPLSRKSSPATLDVQKRYFYRAEGTLHGTGALAQLAPNGTPIEKFFGMLSPGRPSVLSGFYDTAPATQPFTFLNQTYAHNFTVGQRTGNIRLTLLGDVQADGTVRFQVANVSITIAGVPQSDKFVFENGAKMTVGTPLPAQQAEVPRKNIEQPQPAVDFAEKERARAAAMEAERNAKQAQERELEVQRRLAAQAEEQRRAADSQRKQTEEDKRHRAAQERQAHERELEFQRRFAAQVNEQRRLAEAQCRQTEKDNRRRAAQESAAAKNPAPQRKPPVVPTAEQRAAQIEAARNAQARREEEGRARALAERNAAQAREREKEAQRKKAAQAAEKKRAAEAQRKQAENESRRKAAQAAQAERDKAGKKK